jgi:hypothetical protein
MSRVSLLGSIKKEVALQLLFQKKGGGALRRRLFLFF